MASLLLGYSSISFAWGSLNQFSDIRDDLILRHGIDTNTLLRNNFEHSLILSPQFILNAERENSNSIPEDLLNINLGYQYEDQDIDSILRLRANEEGLNEREILIMPPLHNHLGGLTILEDQLRAEIARYRNSIVNEGEASHDRTILIPLNINGTHWTGIVIKILVVDDLSITATYIDSLGNSIPDDIAQSLRIVYGNDINIENRPGLLQTDATSCGPLMIENLIRGAGGINNPSIVSSSQIQRIRAHHVKIAEENRPNLNLRKRQQHNIPSFQDINGIIISTDTLPRNIAQYKLCQEVGLNPATCGGGGSQDINPINTNHENNNKTLIEQNSDQSEERISHFSALPKKIQFEIFAYLRATDLAKSALVSKEWHRITRDDLLWIHRAKHDFSESVLNKAIRIYEKFTSEFNEEDITTEEKEQVANTSNTIRDFKAIYRISRLVDASGTKHAKAQLRKEKGELIEIRNTASPKPHRKTGEAIQNTNSNGFNLEKLINQITAPGSKIKSLAIHDVQLNTNDIQDLADLLKNSDCKITELTLFNNKIDDIAIYILSKSLKNPNCKLTELNIIFNQVGTPGALTIADSLKNPNCKLTELRLLNNHIGNDGAKSIAEALKDPNCNITELDLGFNQINNIGIKVIAASLKEKYCKLSTLELAWNDISDTGAIATAIKTPNCKLTELNLRGNKINDGGIKALATTLKDTNCKLNELNIKYNSIGNTGAKAIARTMMDPKCKVVELKLRGNQISDIGAEAIAKSLKNPHCQLKKLNLYDNRIGTNGILAMADALKNPNCKITKLSLCWQKIRPVAIDAFADALKNPHCKLTKLCIGCNQSVLISIEAFANALADSNSELATMTIKKHLDADETKALAAASKNSNCKLKTLTIKSSHVGPTHAKYLAESLKDPNCKLIKLNLAHNQIGDTGAEAFAAALQTPDCKLIELNIVNNHIGDIGAKALAEAIKDPNCKLTKLYFCEEQISSNTAKIFTKAIASIQHAEEQRKIEIIGIKDF